MADNALKEFKITIKVDNETLDKLEDFIAKQEVEPSKSAVVRLALEKFLAR